ncbi:MAG: archease [Nanoarchaeota archaeon]|nr:archease [Nanoarchaeota archaeon]MBU1104068.1 archease [Nanoarchaeota archaeon]
MRYKFLPHVADIKFRAKGRTLNKTFENAALAVSDILLERKKIKRKLKKEISIKGNDKESLLYNFLEEMIYLLDAENFVVASAEVRIRKNTLKATLSGDAAENYKAINHIKAATYAEMHVKKTAKGWEVQAVLDV